MIRGDKGKGRKIKGERPAGAGVNEGFARKRWNHDWNGRTAEKRE
jgi:hypothetical protein